MTTVRTSTYTEYLGCELTYVDAGGNTLTKVYPGGANGVNTNCTISPSVWSQLVKAWAGLGCTLVGQRALTRQVPATKAMIRQEIAGELADIRIKTSSINGLSRANIIREQELAAELAALDAE